MSRITRPIPGLMSLLAVGIYVAFATNESARAIPTMPKLHRECIYEYSSSEVAVSQTLSLPSEAVLYTQSCATQRRFSMSWPEYQEMSATK